MTDALLPLSKLLFKESRKIHSISDALTTTKLVALLDDSALYARAIGCFFLVFEQLEASLDAAARAEPRLQALRQLALPLYRSAAFEADLEYFLGPGWRADLQAHCSAQPQVEAYTAHLSHLAATAPLLLAAHSFTQHLAVASGGQIIARMVRRGLRLPAGRGTAAFAYGSTPGAARELKEAFKLEFDALQASLSEEEVQQLVQEHCSAFRYNNGIISAYRVGPLAALTAALKLALRTRATAWALAAAAVAVAVHTWRSWARLS